jgi:hypothetical protein
VSPTFILKTVGLILGPYRNLTSLTAAVLSLHPHIQVLNHAGSRLLTRRRNFIKRADAARLDRFVVAALGASTSGKRGSFGGSIQFSHAFDREKVRETYRRRYGDQTMKDDVRCLVWKESGRVTTKLRESGNGIEQLTEASPKMRFLQPVRNPLDCMRSNLRTDHAKLVPGVKNLNPEGVLDAIVENISWFAMSAEKHPERFFMFFEDDPVTTVIDGLIGVLELDDDDTWRRDAADVFVVSGKPYEHAPEMHGALRRSVERHVIDPQLAQRLLRLADPQAVA